MPTDRIELVEGDITRLAVDAIVNAANAALAGGGGVDGAIHRAAGPELHSECHRIGGCPPGEARITHGYDLPAPWVIHTVGPLWRGGDEGEADILANCYVSCFLLAHEKGFRQIAFPAIATGVYGFPLEQAAQIAVDTVTAWLLDHDLPERILFVCFDPPTVAAYRKALGRD